MRKTNNTTTTTTTTATTTTTNYTTTTTMTMDHARGRRITTMLAAASGHTPVIMELIRAGANVNTALEEAVLNAHEAYVLALIHAGADVNMDGFGEAIMQENTATYAEDAGANRNIVELFRYAASRNFLLLELDSV